MRNWIALIALMVCSMTHAEDIYTYTFDTEFEWRGAPKPDPLGIGAGLHIVTLSATASEHAEDTYFAVETALFENVLVEAKFDGVVLLPDPAYLVTPRLVANDSLSGTYDRILISGNFFLNGQPVRFAFSAGIPTDTFTFTESLESPPVFDSTAATVHISSNNDSYAWRMVPGQPVNVTVVTIPDPDPPTVTEQLEELASITDVINLDNGIANALDSKLTIITDAWVAENADMRNDVLNKIASFVNAVEAQRGKKIAESDADVLVAAAGDIADLILSSAP